LEPLITQWRSGAKIRRDFSRPRLRVRKLKDYQNKKVSKENMKIIWGKVLYFRKLDKMDNDPLSTREINNFSVMGTSLRNVLPTEGT